MALISTSIAQNIGALLSLVCALVTVAASEDAAVTATTVDSEVEEELSECLCFFLEVFF